jgi:hypothetical protein
VCAHAQFLVFDRSPAFREIAFDDADTRPSLLKQL